MRQHDHVFEDYESSDHYARYNTTTAVLEPEIIEEKSQDATDHYLEDFKEIFGLEIVDDILNDVEDERVEETEEL